MCCLLHLATGFYGRTTLLMLRVPHTLVCTEHTCPYCCASAIRNTRTVPAVQEVGLPQLHAYSLVQAAAVDLIYPDAAAAAWPKAAMLHLSRCCSAVSRLATWLLYGLPKSLMQVAVCPTKSLEPTCTDADCAATSAVAYGMCWDMHR